VRHSHTSGVEVGSSADGSHSLGVVTSTGHVESVSSLGSVGRSLLLGSEHVSVSDDLHSSSVSSLSGLNGGHALHVLHLSGVSGSHASGVGQESSVHALLVEHHSSAVGSNGSSVSKDSLGVKSVEVVHSLSVRDFVSMSLDSGDVVASLGESHGMDSLLSDGGAHLFHVSHSSSVEVSSSSGHVRSSLSVGEDSSSMGSKVGSLDGLNTSHVVDSSDVVSSGNGCHSSLVAEHTGTVLSESEGHSLAVSNGVSAAVESNSSEVSSSRSTGSEHSLSVNSSSMGVNALHTSVEVVDSSTVSVRQSSVVGKSGVVDSSGVSVVTSDHLVVSVNSSSVGKDQSCVVSIDGSSSDAEVSVVSSVSDVNSVHSHSVSVGSVGTFDDLLEEGVVGASGA